MAAGYQSRAALAREATIYTPTWPSDDAALATQLLPLLSESIGPKIEKAGIATVDSRILPPRIISKIVTGELSVEARYEGLEFFLAASLGFMAKNLDGEAMPEDLGDGLYRHLFEIDRVISQQAWLADEGWLAGDGLIANRQKLRRGTYVIDKGTSVWQAKSCMLNGFQFQANNAACTFTTELLGYETLYNPAVGGDLAGLPLSKERVVIHDGVFYLSDEAPLSSANVISDLVGFSISYQSNLSTTRTIHTRTNIAEPKRVGPALVSGSFAFPTYGSIGPQLQSWTENETSLIGCMEFVRGDYVLRFWLPSVQLTNFDIVVGGPEQVQQQYTFVASTADENPDGFPTNVKNSPLMVELINTVEDHALID